MAAAVGVLALVLALALALLGAATPAEAQRITLRSLPVASGDQFLVLASERLGMGSPRIALDDELFDPFSNPAKGTRLRAPALLSAPTYYNISGGNGSGRTLPVSLLWKGDAWFAGGSVALQQIVNPGSGFFGPCCGVTTLDELSALNLFSNFYLGRDLGGGWSAGGSMSLAGLDAMDGVDLLYAGSESIDQDGSLKGFRLGLVRDAPDGSSVELLLLHDRTDMEHRVVWNPFFVRPEFPNIPDSIEPVPQRREDLNLDRHRVWGAHAGARRPVGTLGWQLGGALTVNRMTHPKIPNYQIQNIPRDPGETWAYDFGVGLARTDGPATVAIDLVFEPIWSETWAEAAEPTIKLNGTLIPVGGRTVENDFFFRNLHIRAGVGRETDRWGLQFGMRASAYSYDLEQVDLIRDIRRKQDESWVEWSPSIGGVIKFPELELRYVGRVTSGTGRPGTAAGGGGRFEADAPTGGGDFIAAPSGDLTLLDVNVWTHQLSVRVPLR